MFHLLWTCSIPISESLPRELKCLEAKQALDHQQSCENPIMQTK